MSKIYLLNNQKFDDVINLEVFKIDYIKKELNLKNYDALVFTSKNAIFAIDSFNDEWKDIDSYVIAKKTASIAKERGAKISFVGSSGHGNDFAYELINKLKNKKVLFLKAKKVVSNLVSILKQNNIDIDEEAIYETKCNKNLEKIELEKKSIIIFTSPSCIECFFKTYSWHESFKAVVIGKTTAKYLPKSVEYYISEITSVDQCVKLAKSIKL